MKKWYKSTTFRGLLTSVIGLTILLVSKKETISDEDIEIFVAVGMQLVGLAVASYGRIKAKDKVVL